MRRAENGWPGFGSSRRGGVACVRVGRRRKTDKHLPARVYLRHGAYYLVDYNGRWIRLGATVSDMYAELGRLTTPPTVKTMADLLHRYRMEVLPAKAAKTQKDNARSLDRLTAVFGRMRPSEVRPVDIYAYRDKRSQKGKTAANRDLEVLKHAFTKGIEWGAVASNPAGDVRKFALPRRTRYVTDAELDVVRAVASPVVRVAMDLAVLTGLRRADLLALTRDNLTDAGILVATSKTGKTLLIEWSDELRAAVAAAWALQPQVRRHLLCTRRGKQITGNGFSTLWRRTIKASEVTPPFRFHDLRAKSASDDDLASATSRLGHSSPAVTERHYRRAPAKVRPLR